MQAAYFRDQIVAGPQRQVVRVAQDDCRAGIAHLLRRQALHRGLSANRHENRCVNGSMGCLQATEPSQAVALQK